MRPLVAPLAAAARQRGAPVQALLCGTVHALQDEIPGLGATVAVDVKHSYAWVEQNTPKAYVPARYDPERQPPGDPDCRLGVNTSSNQVRADGTTVQRKEYVWGYGRGVVAATDSADGAVVLAEPSTPNRSTRSTPPTITPSTYARAVATLGFRPANVTADAAFDAWHIYQTCADHDGIAAIPLNTRGHPTPQRLPDGTPLCPTGLPMSPASPFDHTDGYRAHEFRCPPAPSASDGPNV